MPGSGGPSARATSAIGTDPAAAAIVQFPEAGCVRAALAGRVSALLRCDALAQRGDGGVPGNVCGASEDESALSRGAQRDEPESVVDDRADQARDDRDPPSRAGHRGQRAELTHLM